MDNLNKELFRGEKIKIQDLLLKNVNDKLIVSMTIDFEDSVLGVNFFNVSRFRIGEVSLPLEIQGFEIVENSQKGWDKSSAYEIRDFEDDLINFFCESFEKFTI